MKNNSVREILLMSGIFLVILSIVFSIICIYGVHDSEAKKAFMDSLYSSGALQDQFIFAAMLIVIAIFSSVFQTTNQIEQSLSKDFINNFNGRTEKLSVAERQKLLAEMNYVIGIIEEKISKGGDESWNWQVKLKSAIFSRSRILNGGEIEPAELTGDEKRTLEKESPLLCLKDYGQKTATDPTTVISIKSKMALYRQHRQEQI